MSFTADQLTKLEAPLARSAVKSRSQAGRSLSYIEGWHAIAEANRIFGFGAWDRETVEIREIGEARQVDGKWRVAYLAKVRVVVRACSPESRAVVVREGTGYGSGIDKDVGSAHESALKEAETDAMKRALMTFGNPFGLALYDKEQREVEDDRAAAPARQEAPRPQPQLVTVNPQDIEERRAYMALARSAIANAEFADELTLWWQGQAPKRREYGIVKGTPEYEELIGRVSDTRDKLPANITAAG